jgi:hypothetical protein
MDVGRVYTILLENIAVSTLRTLIEFTAPGTKSCVLLSGKVTQVNSETSTQEEVEIIRKTVAGTGTAVTPAAHQDGDVFGGTARVNCTVEGTLGTRIKREGFNILNGWHYLPTPEERIPVPGGGILALRFAQAPEAAIDIDAELVIGELG